MVVARLRTKHHFSLGLSMPTSSNENNRNTSYNLRSEIHKVAGGLPDTTQHCFALDLQNNIQDSAFLFPGRNHKPKRLFLKWIFKFLLITNLKHFFMYLFIYFISLHVSSIRVLIIRRSSCINTSSGMISLCDWLLGMPRICNEKHGEQNIYKKN